MSPRPRLFAAALVITFAAAGAAHAERTLYYGFTLVDPTAEARTAESYVLVEDGLIAAVGAGAPPASIEAEERRDMSGLFALPGLIDGHAHVTATGIQEFEIADGELVIRSRNDPRITRHNARIALARGVTTIRNPGGDPEANAHYDQMIASGAWIGPEALHAGAVIQPPPFGGGMFAYPRTEAEWSAEAARQADLGMTYFKLYTDLTEEELARGVRAAHEHGLQAVAHLNTVSWTRAAELGVDGLEHALPTSPDLLEPGAREEYLAGLGPNSKFMYRWFELADYEGPRFQEMIELLADEQVVMNMTFVVNEIIANVDDLEGYYPPEEAADAIPDVLEAVFSQLERSATGWAEDDFARARAAMPKVLELGRRLHEAGVPMLIGTDTGGGVLLARELELHVEAGIPVWEVLRMATSGAADILGLGDRIGRIAEGYEANIAFLAADPVTDIRNVAEVEAVIADGRYFTAEDLKGDLP